MYKQIKETKEKHEGYLFAKPNVVGVGVGPNGIVVMVSQKIPKVGLSFLELIPHEIDDIPTDVIQVGHLRALGEPTDRWRPAPGGVSIGHSEITAGTFGAVVHDRDTNDRLILSNNHVMANSNDAQIGDPILQPGPHDGGFLWSDVIALLERFQPIDFSGGPSACPWANRAANVANVLARMRGSKHKLLAIRSDPQASNLVDAAVARPIYDDDILDEILGIGVVSGVLEATLSMYVRKSGRTTGFTEGQVLTMDTSVKVDYGSGRIANFEGQLVSTPMSAPGDSGSLLVARDSQQAVGLLFAGSDQITIYNPIQAVLDSLNIAI